MDDRNNCKAKEERTQRPSIYTHPESSHIAILRNADISMGKGRKRKGKGKEI